MDVARPLLLHLFESRLMRVERLRFGGVTSCAMVERQEASAFAVNGLPDSTVTHPCPQLSLCCSSLCIRYGDAVDLSLRCERMKRDGVCFSRAVSFYETMSVSPRGQDWSCQGAVCQRYSFERDVCQREPFQPLRWSRQFGWCLWNYGRACCGRCAGRCSMRRAVMSRED